MRDARAWVVVGAFGLFGCQSASEPANDMASADESTDEGVASAGTDDTTLASAEESSDQVNDADDTGSSGPETSDSVVDDGVVITTELDPNSDGLSEPNSDDPSGTQPVRATPPTRAGQTARASPAVRAW
jgi:hypothetical protein